MKLCAANLVDNLYRDNFHIETPKSPPEAKITGKPIFEFGDLVINNSDGKSNAKVRTGQLLQATVDIKNSGATGIEEVRFYIDGTIAGRQKFPVVHGNERQISFSFRFAEAGRRRVSIGESREKIIGCDGEPIAFICDSITVSSRVIPAGNELVISARVENLRAKAQKNTIHCFIDGEPTASQLLQFDGAKIQKIQFHLKPGIGLHKIRIGNSPETEVTIYPWEKIDISESVFDKYCAVRAAPCELDYDQQSNTFFLKTAGTDFFHGEDSYGAIFFAQAIQGNFVAKVKLKNFGDRTHEWFRAGLFARNDITQSFESEAGSLGSVLMFVTPGRAGMNWDEHGDGCMHKAGSQNHPQLEKYPMWIKLERHGNSFSGYVSYDGENWTVSRHTQDILGLAKAIHLGLAAGGPNQQEYSAIFENLEVFIEKPDWRKQN